MADPDGLEDQSFRNMVWFWADELRLIINGARLGDVFSSKQVKHLKDLSVLEAQAIKFKRRAGWQGGYHINMVSAEARALLERFN